MKEEQAARVSVCSRLCQYKTVRTRLSVRLCASIRNNQEPWTRLWP